MKTQNSAAIHAGQKPLNGLRNQGARYFIRNFTPNWFAATMGTGILALALAQFPWPFAGLHLVAEGLWMFNILLFSLFSLLYLTRWVCYFNEAKRIFGHSTVSMFFGTIPMGLATIINGLLVFGIPRWGAGIAEIAQVIWWLDVAMALICGVVIPYMMFTRQQHSIDQMTGVWLLPVVAAEVAAVSGGMLAPHLTDAHSQFITIITSYVLWAYSVPVALSILVILLLRMALHKLPHASMAASSWLALGPVGTASLGMMMVGGDAPFIFADTPLASLGEIAQGIGLVTGLLFWGLGLWWMLMAVMITLRYLREGIPFNLGWWGFTFPLGVYTVATLKLFSLTELNFFAVMGGVLTVVLAMMWCLVAAKTARGAWKGNLFVAPCLADIKK